MVLKDVYAEIGTNYRYFLSWRHGLFAGYLATLAAVAIGFSWLYKEAARWALWMPFAAGLVLTGLFWALEYRTRDLFHACQESGISCETGLPAGVGLFTRLRGKDRIIVTHSRVLNVLFVIVGAGMAWGFVWAVWLQAR
jgi:hypothetical protein